MHTTLAHKITIAILIIAFVMPSILLVAPRTSHAFLASGSVVFDPTVNATLGAQNAILTAQSTVQAEDAVTNAVNTANNATNLVQATGNFIVNNARWIKENLLDGLAWSLAKMAVQQISDQTITWINNGFRNPDGSKGPLYITDLSFYTGFVCNQTLLTFVKQMQASELDPQIRRVTAGTLLKTNPCGLQVGDRPSVGDAIFSSIVDDLDKQVGWRTWRQAMMNPLATPYGQYLTSTAELNRLLHQELNHELEQIAWGSGFFPVQQCRTETVETTGVLAPAPTGPGAGTVLRPQAQATQEICETVTPGVAIENRLADVFGSDIRQLELADEINEIITALMRQLMAQVFSSDSSGGLRNIGRESRPGQPSFPTSVTVDEGQKTSVVELVDDQLNNELSFQNTRRAAIAQLEEARTALDELYALDENDPYAIEQEAFIDETIARIEPDITATQPLIDELNLLKDKAENVQTASEIFDTTDQLEDITERGHDAIDVVNAQQELFQIEGQATTIINEVEKRTNPQALEDFLLAPQGSSGAGTGASTPGTSGPGGAPSISDLF